MRPSNLETNRNNDSHKTGKHAHNVAIERKISKPSTIMNDKLHEGTLNECIKTQSCSLSFIISVFTRSATK